MIKKFKQFIAESEENPVVEDPMTLDAKVAAIFQDIDRSYNNFPTIGAIQTEDFLVLEEIKDWKDFTKIAVLGETKTEPAKFYLKFEKGPEEYQVQVNFTFSFKGVENYDSADFGYDPRKEEDGSMGISLEKLTLKKIMVKSESISYSSEKFSKDLGKTVFRFLLNVLKPQFDMIGDEALVIRQL